jgi:ComF family protein
MDLLKREDWEVDFLIPVPLSAGRLAERGYNQAALLARPLALATGLPYRPQALWKVRETPTQVGLTASGRRVNVKDAFQADPALSSGARVLVIDDVTTSGATLEACAEALRCSGARQVFALTLARTSSGQL